MRVACLLLMLLLPRLGAGAPAEPVDENTASLIAQLSPDTDDKVRLEAVLLLGKVGSLPALRAVAEAFRVEAEPLVAASAAQVLGKSGDARWIQVLGTRQKDPQPVVSAAARLWARKLAEGFARGKGVPEGRKSLAIAVTLQPVERTLTDAEIEAVCNKIVAAVAKATGATLRG